MDQSTCAHHDVASHFEESSEVIQRAQRTKVERKRRAQSFRQGNVTQTHAAFVPKGNGDVVLHHRFDDCSWGDDQSRSVVGTFSFADADKTEATEAALIKKVWIKQQHARIAGAASDLDERGLNRQGAASSAHARKTP